MSDAACHAAGGAAGTDAAANGIDAAGAPDRLLRKAETILAGRTERILLVLERCTDNQNYLACLRTAESLGIQDVWIVQSPRPLKHQELEELGAGMAGGCFDTANEDGGGENGSSNAAVSHGTAGGDGAFGLKKKGRIARQSAQWLDLRLFVTTAQCLSALRAGGYTIWATDLSQTAVPLESSTAALSRFPARLAIVMGREADGVSQEMLNAADARVYLPMFGFNDSLNLSVATAMVLQQLFAMCPEARGDLSDQRRAALRAVWYARLARNDAQRAEFLSRVDNPPPPFQDARRPDEHRTNQLRHKVAKKDAAALAAAAAALEAAQAAGGSSNGAGSSVGAVGTADGDAAGAGRDATRRRLC